jgi:hypothetical protein
MKFFFAASLLAFSTPAFAAPGVLTVNATLTPATNPNGHCGASEYGYIFDATYTDKTGAEESISDCVESVAIPLDASECLKPKKMNDIFKASSAILKAASRVKNAPKFTIAVDDMDNPDAGTILRIESDCK